MIWGVASLIWFVGTTAVYSTGLVGDRVSTVSSRPAPLLGGSECNRVVEIEGQRSCSGVADMARQRRVMLQDREASQSVAAGTIILGPPLLSLLGVVLAMRYATRRGDARGSTSRTR